MHHQRVVEWRRPGSASTVGMLRYKPTFDDPHAKWFVVPIGFGGVTVMRVPWEAVEAGEFFRVPPRTLSVEEERTLARYFRQHLAEECGKRSKIRTRGVEIN
ncbi:hypothetical protein C0216_08690 [Streptomyces globosus]|uniref:Uncharacterized protein n=1 Tax=Streptomyces globosus TaxID=68209 RepID=A0A344TY08_9ACTN|nr:hypothetical protein [Streptomyces globosus]AXE23529.1 hypothetical protein C0216_08690 [Streptomyces globosus]